MRVHVLGEGRSGAAARTFLESLGDTLVEKDPELVILSPGIPLSDSRCQAFQAAGVEIIGEMELGLRHVNRPAVGVTGTNGKTTTVEWTAQAIGGVACGNNGYALTRALLETNGPLVIEMSSYQLETASARALDGAVILNVTPDHLDRYPNFESYKQAKERIALCLKKGAPLYRDVSIEEAVAHLSSLFGVSEIPTFAGLPHRYERVCELDGILCINDSKATNLAAVLHALEKTPEGIQLLMGGLDKGDDFRSLAPFASKIKKIYVFGRAADVIMAALKHLVDVEKVDTLKQASKKAFKEAGIGDTILLSPGCSSFDQFRDFEQRGEKFKEYCLELRLDL